MKELTIRKQIVRYGMFDELHRQIDKRKAESGNNAIG